jgi:hypothetical protein
MSISKYIKENLNGRKQYFDPKKIKVGERTINPYDGFEIVKESIDINESLTPIGKTISKYKLGDMTGDKFKKMSNEKLFISGVGLTKAMQSMLAEYEYRMKDGVGKKISNNINVLFDILNQDLDTLEKEK